MLYSLKDKKTISNILKSNDKIYTKYLIIKYIRNNFTKNPKFLVLIPKKYFKLATIRNKIRRQIKAIILQNNILSNVDKNFIVIVNPKYMLDNFLETKNSLLKILLKL